MKFKQTLKNVYVYLFVVGGSSGSVREMSFRGDVSNIQKLSFLFLNNKKHINVTPPNGVGK